MRELLLFVNKLMFYENEMSTKSQLLLTKYKHYSEPQKQFTQTTILMHHIVKNIYAEVYKKGKEIQKSRNRPVCLIKKLHTQ